MIKVDVLLATYNGEAFIQQQIVSILDQTHTDIRLLIRDDGSTDRTCEIIDALCALDTERLVRITDGSKNLGAAGNFAALLEHSTAPYCMFADQDDVWMPDKIEATLACMLEAETLHPASACLVFTDVAVGNAAGEVVAPSFFDYMGILPTRTRYPALFLQNTVIGCTVMVNHALVAQALPLPQAIVMHDWWLALVASGLGHIAFLDRATMLYRQHGGNQVGAWRYGLANLLQLSPSRLRQAYRNYNAAVGQVRLLVEHHGARLRPADFDLARRFTAIPALGWIERRLEARRLGLGKSGRMRTMLLYAMM